jgi:hypothetical protein
MGILQRVKIHKRATLDTSKAPPPSGESGTLTTAALDLTALDEQLAAVMERAGEDRPDVLKQQVARLQGELREARQARPTPNVVEKVVEVEKRVEVPVIPVLTRAEIERQLGQAQEALNAANEQFRLLLDSLSAFAPDPKRLPAAPDSPGAAALPAPADAKSAKRTRRRAAPTPPSGPPQKPTKGTEPTEPQAVLARFYPVRLTRRQLLHYAGKVPRSLFLAQLRDRQRDGLVDERDDLLGLTAKGVDTYLPSLRPVGTSGDALALWKRALPDGAWSILDALLSVFPRALTREKVGEMTGYSVGTGTFKDYVAILRQNGLIAIGRGDMKATEVVYSIPDPAEQATPRHVAGHADRR